MASPELSTQFILRNSCLLPVFLINKLTCKSNYYGTRNILNFSSFICFTIQITILPQTLKLREIFTQSGQMLSKIVKQVYSERPPTQPSIIFFSLSDSNYPPHKHQCFHACPNCFWHFPATHATAPHLVKPPPNMPQALELHFLSTYAFSSLELPSASILIVGFCSEHELLIISHIPSLSHTGVCPV